MSTPLVDPGQHAFWLASRAVGVVALALISLAVGLGLALSSRLGRRPGSVNGLKRVHEAIALSGLVAIVAHGALLLGDGFLKPGLIGVLLPFQMDRQPIWTGIGILAGWLAMIVGLSFYARRWITTPVWRWLHRWTLAVYVMGLAHTFGSGTDAGAPWLLATVAVTALPIVFAGTFRLLPPARPQARPRFHPVSVAAVEPLTADSVQIELGIPDELAARFRFNPGQHLVVRTEVGGEEVRRSYSICSPVSSRRLRIAVRQVEGGIFSTLAVHQLRTGDRLEVMAPTGSFGPKLHPRNSRHYVGIAAGSGITPILSILTSALEVERRSRFTLVYGNRTRASTMFASELERLEAMHPDRLEVIHVRSRESVTDPLRSGRVDKAKIERLLATRLPAGAIAGWYLCGPTEMVEEVRGALLDGGVGDEKVHSELFRPVLTGEPDAVGGVASRLTVRLDGTEREVELGAGELILDGALQLNPDTPYSCRAGSCGGCRARVVDGDAEMLHNFALDRDEVGEGYVLTCQSHASSPELTVDFDA